jgi:uncharacterized phiE125 gp8 family phage protein
MLPRSVVVVTQPTVEPVTLSEARLHLRLSADQTDDDRLIASLISTGRALVEKRLGVSLVKRRLRATYSGEGNVLELPSPPLLLDVDHELEITADGVAVSEAAYEVDSDSRPATVTLSTPQNLPMVVTFWAGGQPLAPQLRSAILLYVGHLYSNRELVVTDGSQPAELPFAFETLLASESVTGVW